MLWRWSVPGTLPRAEPRAGSPTLVQIVDHDLRSTVISLEENCVWPKESFRSPSVAHRKALADHQQAASPLAQRVVHGVGQLGQAQVRLCHGDQQRHLALRIGQAGGGRDEADLAAHGLHHQHRVGGAGAGVLLVGVLHVQRPVAGHAAIARRVVDQLERRRRPHRCRSSWARRRRPGPARARQPAGRPCGPCPWCRCRRCRRSSRRRGP